MQASPPTHPDYEVQSLLQRGARSTLYRAFKTSDHHAVILKVRNANVSAHRGQGDLSHEFSVGKKLRDARGVAQALDLITLGDTHALVVEDFGACSLDQFIRGNPLEITAFFKIAIGIAKSLSAIHGHNVLHKDIKPRSILVHPKTLEVKVSDFGSASLLPFVEQNATSPSRIAGTFAYLAPEQTGRMNRPIDPRADLYSLGITLYEVLTGKLPFEGNDALEWFHLHIAVEPPSPKTLREDIPDVLAALILKLISKAPEDRYQSAFGLKDDLERCLAEYSSKGWIESFILGESDVVGEVQVPHKLYGRASEVSAILQAFSNVSLRGQPELVLVSGYPGVGKTSLVNELHKPVVEKRAFFISGKFDQYRRGVPYATIAEAFRDLINQLLTGSEEELLFWKKRITHGLGPNAGLIFGIIPELELVLGKQPTTPELAPAETINRFNLTFQAFVRVFAKPGHPIVLFLDDMQWADSATLGLIEKIMTDSELGSLLLVLAYRDNEVDNTHSFSLTLQKLHLEEKRTHRVFLKPLGLEHVNELVSDSIKRPESETIGLSRIIYEKTAGNPFFVIEFLKNLNHEKLLTFDSDQRLWFWNESKISARNITDNVVHLMSAKVERLPDFTRRALMLASCVGSEFDRTTLSIVLETTPGAGDIERALESAVASGLVISILDQRQEGDARQTFRFQHDRIQQAAYSLIPEEERKGIHLKIGRLLLSQLNVASLEERFFEVIDQFNHSLDLLTDPAERLTVMDLNFRAGQRAKASTAYRAALKYYTHALELSPSNFWDDRYSLAFDATLGKGECEYLLGNASEGEGLFHLVLKKAHSALDQARVYQVWLNLYQFSGKYTEGLEAGAKGLRLLGIDLPESQSALQAAIEAENTTAEAKLGGKPATYCLELPPMTDPRAKAALELLAACGPSAFMSRPELFPLIDLKMVNLSLEYGNAPTSGFAYSMYAMLLVSPYKRNDRADEFSKMSIELNRRFQDPHWKGMIVHIHANHIGFWKNRFESSLPYIDEAFNACIQAGDFVTSNYVAFMSFWLVYESGKPLSELYSAAERFASFTKQSKSVAVSETLRFYKQFARSLRGETIIPGSFEDEAFNEKSSLDDLEKANFLPGVLLFHLSKTIGHYVLGQYGDARRSSEQSYLRRAAGASLPSEATVPYFHALSLAADFESLSVQEQKDAIKLIRKIASQLSYWAENAPENYGHRHAFVLAELARIEGSFEKAVKYFSEAIELVGKAKINQDEALIHERLASLFYSRGITALSETHLSKAFQKFQDWGAIAKIQQLRKRYPHLLPQVSQLSATLDGVPNQGTELIDLKSVMRAAQAISEEIEINRLMDALIRILIENAGAQKGALFLIKGEKTELAILADVHVQAGKAEVRVRVQPNEGRSPAPLSLLNYVKRTKQKVLLEDAAMPNLFSNDEYFKEARPKSVLCIPILKLQDLVAILYLENTLISGVFTEAKLSTLELLSSQAAISLENARLFKETQDAAELRISLDREKSLSAEREIARGELHELFMQAPVGIALLDGPAHIFSLANSSYLSMLFTSDHNLIGKSVIQVAPEAEHQGHIELLNEVYKTGIPYIGNEVPLELRRESGAADHFFINFVYQARRNIEGQILGIIAVVTDVTEQVTIRKRIEESLRARDEFLSIASHELKTPVTSLKMQLQMTRRGVKVDEGIAPPPAKLAKTLDLSVRQVDRLSALIEDLLDVSRVESGKMTYNFEAVEISALVDEVIERFFEQLQAAKCKLKINLSEKVTITCDRFRVEQVVTNLITNAMKYGAGSLVEVTVSALESGAVISVTDSGMGIAKEKQAQIFDRFERAISHKNISGLGLGLYISKQIVDAHGGYIELKSELGKGSTFTVELPIAPLLRRKTSGIKRVNLVP